MRDTNGGCPKGDRVVFCIAGINRNSYHISYYKPPHIQQPNSREELSYIYVYCTYIEYMLLTTYMQYIRTHGIPKMYVQLGMAFILMCIKCVNIFSYIYT